MKFIRRFKTDDNSIVLTFDDGPDEKNTPEILKILSEHGVKATFFVTGKNAEKFPGLISQIQKDGHEIGSHSFSHSSLRFKSAAFIEEEIVKTDNLLESLGIKEAVNFRPPYGRYFPFVPFVAKRLRKNIILWDVGPKDYKKTVSEIVDYVITKTKSGSIIVLHDGGGDRKITVEALKILIPKMLKKGFHFRTAAEMMKIY